MGTIARNIETLREEIAVAAQRSGRSEKDVKLVVVTKNHPVESIIEAVNSGISDIGENRVQEILGKWQEIEQLVPLHFIGQLQANKVKYIIDKAAVIQSLDRLSLAQEISHRAQAVGRTMPVLVQVNLTQDSARGGVPEGELPDFIKRVDSFANLSLRGLMAVAPLADPDTVRRAFSRMRSHFEVLGRDRGQSWDTLSMGMSNDYKTAIEEGATLVRVGSAIFGRRQ